MRLLKSFYDHLDFFHTRTHKFGQEGGSKHSNISLQFVFCTFYAKTHDQLIWHCANKKSVFFVTP